jgi:hypothetical protein
MASEQLGKVIERIKSQPQNGTSGVKAVKTLKDCFATTGTTPVTRDGTSTPTCPSPSQHPYLAAGGLWTIMAQLGAAADCVAVPVTGTNPKCSTISSLLNSLYTFMPSGGTASLLNVLAQTESTHVQFLSETLTLPKSQCSHSLAPPKLTGLWPQENKRFKKIKMGTFIGLMMVPTTQGTAWDWTKNAMMGANTFKGNIETAMDYEDSQVSRTDLTPQLVAMTGLQREDSAIGLFKGVPKKRPLLTPQCFTNPSLTKGTCSQPWAWGPNPNPCPTSGTTNCPGQNVIDLVATVRATSVTCTQ